MKRLSIWLMAVSLLLALNPAPAEAAARYVLITLLHTNDMHGRVAPVDETGGLARIATLVRGIRAEMPNVLLLDAGDIIHGTPEDYYTGGLASISAMNATGYHLATPGNHEFDFGQETFKGVMSVAAFPFVSANIKSVSGGQWDRLAFCSVTRVDGVRIGVIGLSTPETLSLQWPNRVNEIKVEDPIATASALVPQMRAQADVVVVLSHLGQTEDLRLASAVPGIDFIIGGHSHTVINERRTTGTTVVAQAGAYSRALGRIDFMARVDESKAEIISIHGVSGDWNKLRRPPLGRTYPEHALIPVDHTVPEDTDVLKAYLPYREATEKHLSNVVGHTTTALPGGGADSPAASLAADAVRALTGADIALVDSRSVNAAGLPVGPVQVRHIHNLITGYTRQHIVVGKMRGSDLTRAMTARTARSGQPNLAISGATYTYSTASGVGLSADPSLTYTVAAQAYVMMDIMNTVPGVEIIAEPRETAREAVVRYFQQLSPISAPEAGRVTTTSKP